VNHAARLIVEAADEFDAEMVVVGLPTSAAGTETPACARTHAIVDALTILGVAVALQSEYLTTDEARRRARESGRRIGQPVDDIAAQVILEEFLENRSSGGDPR
jgi:putative transcription antitermination factor YqgF